MYKLNRLELPTHVAAVHEYGNASPDKTPWLLIHGGGHDHEVWRTVASGLGAAGERVLVPDLPAHGDSTGAALTDIDAMAAWLLALLPRLQLQQLRLCGHSMGSLIALAAAAAAPEQVQRLVLIGSSAPMPVSDFLLEAARSEPARAHELINKFSFAPAEVLGNERRQQLEEANLARMQRQGAAVLLTDLGACNAWQGGLTAAARVRCPSLLLCGEFDRMTPAAAAAPLLEALGSSGSEARQQVLAGSGHTMMEEVPQDVIAALLA